MDIADDWRQQFNLDLYIQTYDAAISFAREHPDTLWCYKYRIEPCPRHEKMALYLVRKAWSEIYDVTAV